MSVEYKLHQYSVEYKLAGTKEINVTAPSAEEAEEEIDRIFRGEEPIYEDNQWIDEDILWNMMEWTTTQVTNVTEE